MNLHERAINDIDFLIVDVQHAARILRINVDDPPDAMTFYNKTFLARFNTLKTQCYTARTLKRRWTVFVRLVEVSNAYYTLVARLYPEECTRETGRVMRPQRVLAYTDGVIADIQSALVRQFGSNR